MARALGGFALGALVMLQGASAHAAPIAAMPELTLDIGGEVFDIGQMGVETDKGFRWGTAANPMRFTSSAGDEFSIFLDFDQDPEVTYSIGVTDVGSPSLFNFTFGGAIVPVPAPAQVLGSIGGTLTDATQNGVSISGLAPNLIQRSFLSGPSDPITNMGVDVGNPFSSPCAPPGGTCNLGVVTYPTETIGYLPAPAQVGSWDNLQVVTAFSLSGGGDTAAISGIARILPIPEPGTALLLGFGLAALARTSRRA